MYHFIIPKQLLWRSRGRYCFSIFLRVFHSLRTIGLVFIEFVLTCPSPGSTYIANEDETPHVPKEVGDTLTFEQLEICTHVDI